MIKQARKGATTFAAPITTINLAGTNMGANAMIATTAAPITAINMGAINVATIGPG